MNFNTIKSSDFCEKIFDGTHDSPKNTNTGYHLVTSKYINNGKIDFNSAPLISLNDFNKANSRSKVEQGDILISMIGTVGLIARIKDNPEYAIKNIGVFRTKNEMDSKYLVYYLQSKKFQDLLSSKLAGSTQQYISLDNLRNIDFLIPSRYEDQQHIVDTITNEVILCS